MWEICFHLASLSAVCVSAHADHPSHEITFRLGPENKLVEAMLPGPKVAFSKRHAAIKRLSGIDLSGRDLRGAEIHMYEESLKGVSFDSSDLTGADLSETHFRTCTFRGAKLRRVFLGQGDLIGPGCDLTDADISESYLRLERHQLESTRTYKTKNLSGLTLYGDVSGTSFAGFSLCGAVLNANLTGCDFDNADIRGAKLKGLSVDQLRSTKNYQEKDLDGVTFVDSDFRSADFRDFNLGRFERCDLRSADFEDASFTPAPSSSRRFRYGFAECLMKAKQLYTTRSFKQRRLVPQSASFVLSKLNLDGADFRAFDLRGVTFHSCSLRDAKFQASRGGEFRSSLLTTKQRESLNGGLHQTTQSAD